MVRKVSFSGANLSLAEATLHHTDITDALRLYFSDASPFYEDRFFNMRTVEVGEALLNRLKELDNTSAMHVLACIEAMLRIDYLKRCYHKKKDKLSLQFRYIYTLKQESVSLEDEILDTWRDYTNNASLFSEVKGAFKFRHWLAHGRYWTPKLGRQKYDYPYVYQLALAISSLPLQT